MPAGDRDDQNEVINCQRCGENSLQTEPNYEILRCLHIASSVPHLSEILTPPSLPQPDNDKAILQVPKCEFCEENNAYSYCQDCNKLKYLCDDCYAIRHKKSPLDQHTRVPWKPQYRNPVCRLHDQECLIFCKTDSIPICTLCNYGDHVGHDTCLMDTEIIESESRISTKLCELEKKARNIRTVYLEANEIYTSLCGNSLLASDKESGMGTIGRVTQEIHSHFYALRHLLQQKEDELISLVKEKAQEKLSKLSRQVDDAVKYLTKAYLIDQSIHRFFAEMPHCWILENEPLIIQHIQKLINNECDNTGLLLHDHVVTSPEILFQFSDPSNVFNNYRIQSEVILPIQPLSAQQSSGSFTPSQDHGEKMNDFLSDPIFSCSPEAPPSKFFSIVEEEPYICYPGVTKQLTICSVNSFNEKIVVGGGGGEIFHCTLEKQELTRSVTPTSSSKRTSSRRSVTPPHFRHTCASLPNHKSPRSSTPPPTARSTNTRSTSLPRTSSGSSLHSFGSHSTLSTPKKQTLDSLYSISPRQVLVTSPTSPCHEDARVVDNSDGTYSLAVVAQKQGLYRLNITLSGEHIRGSPFILHSEYHTGIIGSKGSATGYFSTPYGVHFHQETQQLFVSDSSNNRIQIFTSNGEFVNSFGTHGKANGQFSWPLGLCVCNDRIYVSDNMNNRIQILDLEGSFVSSIGLNTKTHTQLLTPYDICCDGDLIFIADSGNKRIQVFNFFPFFLFAQLVYRFTRLLEIMSDRLPSKGNKDYFLGLLEFVVEMDWFLCQITTTTESLSLQLKANINGRSEAREATKESFIYLMVSLIPMVCCMFLIVETIEYRFSRKKANSFE